MSDFHTIKAEFHVDAKIGNESLLCNKTTGGVESRVLQILTEKFQLADQQTVAFYEVESGA